MTSQIIINNRIIGRNYRPFIIAEMSGNHNQSLEKALDIVRAAAQAGVDALKLQTYTADTITLNIDDGEFFIDDPNSLWKGTSLYNLYQQAYTPWEWHRPIFDECKRLGLLCFSTPFDETAVDFLEELDVPCYKIASFENADIPLLKKVASTGKPVFISTGMATLAELDESVRTLRKGGCKELILLKCTSSYPASPIDSNIATIPNMKELFAAEVGISDHTLGVGVAIASVALGATVIEKHFTLSRAEGGVDSAFSLEPEEFKMLVLESTKAWEAIGGIKYGVTETEKDSMRFRRSIYISEDIKKGDTLTKENIRIVRPGYGLAPKYYDILLGKRINNDVRKGTPLSWKILL